MVETSNYTPERIADRLAIQEALHRYCRGVDRIQLKILASVFHEDATLDYGAHKFTREQFLTNVGTRHPTVSYASHMVMNFLIDFLGADRAFVETWGLALEQHPAADGKGPSIDRTYRVRYGDIFEMRAGDWRVAKRILVMDHVMSATVDPALAPNLTDRLMGRRDAKDPILQARVQLGLKD
jgi:hypothetical protein